jgi:hypothetical protein
MKYQVDLKSIAIGFIGAALLFIAFSFKNGASEKEGKYQATAVQEGIVILDTETGAFIMSTNLYNNAWQKGDFVSVVTMDKGRKK